MPTSMPTNSSENLTMPIATATATIHRHGAPGPPRITSSGSDASVKRSADSSSGGKSSRPTSTITKFRPQMAATSTATATWAGRMPGMVGRGEAKFQWRFLRKTVSSAFEAMLDARRLRVLRELAARGTIAATADALGYTAPAVSQQLAALEREAGIELLERNGRRKRLTPAGEELVARTEGILRELEAAEAAIERTTTYVAGVLRC